MNHDPTPWHLDADLTRAYAESRTSPVLTASVEQHLVGCATCRAPLAALVPGDRLEQSWAGVLERVQQPRRGWLERVLVRVGVGEDTARLLALTPSLRSAWLTGVAVVLSLAVLAAYADPHGIAIFLAIAPLAPAAGVALAFGPASDPSHEMTAATSYPFLRLLAARTSVVVASTMGPALVAGLLLPGSLWIGVAWLVPALAFAAVTLALGARVGPLPTVVVLAGAWFALTLPGLRPAGDPVLAASPAVQAAAAVLGLGAAAFLVARRRDLPEMIR